VSLVALREKGLHWSGTALFVALVVVVSGHSVLAASTICYVALLACGCRRLVSAAAPSDLPSTPLAVGR
jgi:hypothetical protein